MVEPPELNEKVQEAIRVQVCYAATQKTTMIELMMKCGSTIREAIAMSQILMQHPEVDIDVCKVGIFGKIKLLSAVIRQGDRIEVYRPLTADPMEARRRRSAKQLRMKSSL